jgi:hypothetical protein
MENQQKAQDGPESDSCILVQVGKHFICTFQLPSSRNITLIDHFRISELIRNKK